MRARLAARECGSMESVARLHKRAAAHYAGNPFTFYVAQAQNDPTPAQSGPAEARKKSEEAQAGVAKTQNDFAQRQDGFRAAEDDAAEAGFGEAKYGPRETAENPAQRLDASPEACKNRAEPARDRGADCAAARSVANG